MGLVLDEVRISTALVASDRASSASQLSTRGERQVCESKNHGE